MENTKIKMINDEYLKEVSGGAENREINRYDTDRMLPLDHCIIAVSYGFKPRCLHRVKMKKRIDSINKNY